MRYDAMACGVSCWRWRCDSKRRLNLLLRLAGSHGATVVVACTEDGAGVNELESSCSSVLRGRDGATVVPRISVASYRWASLVLVLVLRSWSRGGA